MGSLEGLQGGNWELVVSVSGSQSASLVFFPSVQMWALRGGKAFNWCWPWRGVQWSTRGLRELSGYTRE